MKRLLAILIIISTLLAMSSCTLFIRKPKLNGTKITKYQIVCDAEGLDYNTRAAEYIRDKILERSGIELDIVDDGEPVGEYEIVVGETSRDISKELDADTEGFEFAILSKDGSVALEGDRFVIAAAAYYFTETYAFENGKKYDIPEGVSIHTPIVKTAKNFIMLIGDGMGVYQTKLFDYLEDTSDYSDGESVFYGYMFPSSGYSRTQSLSGITDSAAGGTALSTGYKTYNDYVGLDKNGNEIKSLTELAAELGKATAVMSTETDTGATPSTFSAHTLSRDNNIEILEDQIAMTHNYGTVIDCGFDYYNERNINKIVEKHITDTLGKLDTDEDGFFIMYEEAHIDKKCHNNDMEATFLALIRFNQAIARFMEYAFYNPDTFVLITADHETGSLLPDSDGVLAYNSETHSADDVPVFAWGEGSDFFNGKTVENIEIAQRFASLMGVEDFGDKTGEWYNTIYGVTGSGNTTELPIIPVG